jgi:Effector-associated domain 7/Effector-associated domain 10
LIRYSILRPVLDRVAKGTCTDADIDLLRAVILEGILEPSHGTTAVSVGGSVKDSLVIAGQDTVQIGKYVIPTQDTGNLKVGRRVYKGEDSEAIRELLRQLVADLVEVPADTRAADTRAADTRGGTASPAANRVRLKLYDALCGGSFSMEDLEDLCFRLDVNWDNLAGDTKAKKARSIVHYFERCGEIYRLCETVTQLRPELRARLEGA